MKYLIKLSSLAAASLLTACGGGGSLSDLAESAQVKPSAVQQVHDSSYSTQEVVEQPKVSTPNGLILGAEDSNRGYTSGLHEDVKQAHKEGWTGKGIQVFVLEADSATDNGHASSVSAIISRNAPAASVSVDFHKEFAAKRQLSQSTVVNLSVSPAAGQSSESITSFTTGMRQFFPNAVIVKSAGNNAIGKDSAIDSATPSVKESLTVSMLTNPATKDRTIAVGALTSDGSPEAKASIAYYSSTAGTNQELQKRFLVANGNDPFTGDKGVSFAAPRVAGYAAIAQQKFKNLTPETTARLLLSTARTDTIVNYNPSVHGMGEASLSNALSPVGKLK